MNGWNGGHIARRVGITLLALGCYYAFLECPIEAERTATYLQNLHHFLKPGLTYKRFRAGLINDFAFESDHVALPHPVDQQTLPDADDPPPLPGTYVVGACRQYAFGNLLSNVIFLAGPTDLYVQATFDRQRRLIRSEVQTVYRGL